MNDLLNEYEVTDEAPKNIDINQLEDLAALIKKEEAEEDRLNALYKEQKGVTEVLRDKMMFMLKACNKKKYASNVGTFTIAEKMSVRVPADWNAKQALFDWLKERGNDTFMTYATVNSQSLNALWNREYEAAEDKSNFAIAGIDAPTVLEQLRFKKV